MTAAAFFTMREYIISPILVHTLPLDQYERRRHELGISRASQETDNLLASTSGPQFSSMRSQKVLDSALSGMAAGGLLRGLRSGPKAAVSGAITVGAAATLLQLGFNEFTVQRLKLISRQRSPEGGIISTTPQSGLTLRSPLAIEQGPTPGGSPTPEQEPTSWKTKALSLLGIKKLSEDEYLQRLKLQRENHLLRIAELERKLEEEKAKDNASGV